MAAADGLVMAALNSAASLRQALQARFDYISPSANDADTPMNKRKPGIGMSTHRRGGVLATPGITWNRSSASSPAYRRRSAFAVAALCAAVAATGAAVG